MRLYVRPIAPNALKVSIFLAERGLAVETVDVGTIAAEDYARISPLRQVPVLETDDGLILTESLTICQYLDALAEGPSLFGEGLEERAVVAMWERRAELGLLDPGIEYGHHTQPMFAGKLVQFPEWAKARATKTTPVLALVEAQLAAAPFLAGERFTMADITGYLGVVSLAFWGALPAPPGPATARWMGELGARPSLAPLQALAAHITPHRA